MVCQTAHQRVPVVQVGVHRQAERAGVVDQRDQIGQGSGDRGVDVVRQFVEARVVGGEVGQVERMVAEIASAPREVAAGLADPDMAGVDAQADPLRVPASARRPPGTPPAAGLPRTRRTTEPGRRGSVPLRTPRTAATTSSSRCGISLRSCTTEPLTDPPLPQRSRRPGPRWSGSSRLTSRGQMDHRRARAAWGDGEHPVQVLRRTGVHLGGEPCLLEPQPGQRQYRVVAADALLEQRVQRHLPARRQRVHAGPGSGTAWADSSQRRRRLDRRCVERSRTTASISSSSQVTPSMARSGLADSAGTGARCPGRGFCQSQDDRIPIHSAQERSDMTETPRGEPWGRAGSRSRTVAGP